MKIYINQDEYIVDNSLNIFQVLELANMSDRKGIAVAVNNKVIPKTLWEKSFVFNEDKIILITAACGG